MSTTIKRKIYLSGPMSGLPFEMQMAWRRDFIDIVGDRAECFNPPAHFSDYYIDNNVTDFSGYKSDREVMDFDLWNLEESDIVVVNFDDSPLSLGTMAEVAIAYACRIPVFGFCKNPDKLHPWQRDMCYRMFESYKTCAIYLLNHYL